MANLVLKASRQVASDRDPRRPSIRTLILDTLEKFGAEWAVESDEATDDGQYFYINNIADDRVEKLREALAGLDGVEAAYAKPADELPM